jgi:NTE family protein
LEIKIDNTKTYAVALEGGGAKGAYEIGVWKALDEAGIKYNAVSGTSVGSMNAALMAMGDLDHAIELWENVSMSQVINADPGEMERLIKQDIRLDDLGGMARQVVNIISNRGLDITPLRNLLRTVVDADKIKNSGVELFITTVSLTDKKELEVRLNDLDRDEMCDMLLASSYLPAFRLEPLGGKFYADGGFKDAVPIHVLIENGYRDIIEVRMHGIGRKRRFKIPDDASIITVDAWAYLGKILNFVPEQSRYDLQVGYLDGKRALYGLYGRQYYIERTLSEREALDMLIEAENAQDGTRTMRDICESEIPALARFVGAADGSYYDILTAALEHEADALGVEKLVIRTDRELMDAINAARAEGSRI